MFYEIDAPMVWLAVPLVSLVAAAGSFRALRSRKSAERLWDSAARIHLLRHCRAGDLALVRVGDSIAQMAW